MNKAKNRIASASAPTRRQMITGSVITLGGLALGSARSFAQTTEEISHAAESIHMEPVINASPKRVYDVLTTAKQFNDMTKLITDMGNAINLEKSPTVISPDPGGAF